MRRRTLDPGSLERHLDRMLRAARAMTGDPDTAQDLVQATCLQVLARQRRLRGDEELPYLLSALRNVFLNERRGQRRRLVTTAVPVDAPAPPSADPAVQVAEREIYAVISALPAEQRDALVAVDVVGLSYQEAAELLDVKPPTLATRLYRGRDRVARELADPS